MGDKVKEGSEYLGIEQRSGRGPQGGRSRIKILLRELKAVKLEILYRQVLRRHSYLSSNWIRAYNRFIASKYDFWYDDPDCIGEHLPELLRQCSDIEEVQKIIWWMEKAVGLRRDLDVNHGRTQRKHFELYRIITGEKENI